MSAEKIILDEKKDLAAFMTPKVSEKVTSVRVDINDLLARVRKEKVKENKTNLVFFCLFASLVLIVGLLLSF